MSCSKIWGYVGFFVFLWFGRLISMQVCWWTCCWSISFLQVVLLCSFGPGIRRFLQPLVTLSGLLLAACFLGSLWLMGLCLLVAISFNYCWHFDLNFCFCESDFGCCLLVIAGVSLDQESRGFCSHWRLFPVFDGSMFFGLIVAHETLSFGCYLI